MLKKIRQALSSSVPLPFPQSEGSHTVYKYSNEEAIVQFAEEFTKLQGKFVYCANIAECIDQLQHLLTHMNWTKVYFSEPALINMLKNHIRPHTTLPDCDVSITGCEYLIARTGSIVLTAKQQHGRTTSVYAPVHICIAFSNQLKPDIKEALQSIKENHDTKIPSLITFATGPSRTADIEKTLVTGVHGPKEVYCYLIEDEA